ncbi:MAG: sigma-70 family RNA polymerase sigma factor [Burkholderiales bacterium]|nr:sigma-70 family RNA polymerase sigma factor [Burkholderiales bacterium]
MAMSRNPDGDARLRQLLAQAAARDDRSQAAFAELYRLTAAKLFGVTLRILRRRDWAEEVLQECFMKIWSHSASYQAELAAPMTWMTSIVRNRCLDWLRRPAFEDATDDSTVWESLESGAPGPHELLERGTQADAVLRCLAALDDRQRRAVSFAFLDGLTHTELADRLGEPLGTVKTWVRRGLLRLKDCLARAGVSGA